MDTAKPQEAGTPVRQRILVLSQTFHPDPASVGQHMTDVAVELARRGHEVLVYTAARGYDDPTIRYAPREVFKGVKIRRLPLSSFGKKSILTRVIGTFSFMCQCILICLFLPRVKGIFISTSPPLIGLAAFFAKFFRRIPFAYWAMDLNPDQLIVLGKIKQKSLAAWVLETVNRAVLKHADFIIALDRFMVDRLRTRGDYSAKMLVMPPWAHDEYIETIAHEQNTFRHDNGLDGKFVVMYSGNHGLGTPLKTLLEAAVRLKDDDSWRFVFVGGGKGKAEVEQTIADHRLKNTMSLPYQPMSNLKYSLSAADVHVVSLGDNMAGIIHPCKIYGAMSIGRPILFLGPTPSHISDILSDHKIGWQVSHGDVDGMSRTLAEIRATSQAQLTAMGLRGQRILREHYSQEALEDQLTTRLEEALKVRNPAARVDTVTT